MTASYAESDAAEETAIKFAAAIGDQPFPYSDPARSLDKDEEGFGAYTRIHHARDLVLVPHESLPTATGGSLTLKLRFGVFDLAAFCLVAQCGEFYVTSDSHLSDWIGDTCREKGRRKLAELKASRKAIKSIATPVLRERPPHLERPTHRFERGLFLAKDEPVQPGVPSAIDATDASVADRLAFAEWLVDDANPLTDRVAVNRLWARMFGVGLVATEEDFGSSGDLPSHPELLDDLAVRFRLDYGWSMKSLLREIALSRAYRQSSEIVSEFQRSDSLNRALSRGPRHTLPAESIRDQMLSISGLLDLTVGGPPVFPPIPSGVWKARRGTWKTAGTEDPNRYRRSVYTYVKRSVPYPLFDTFDAPSRTVCAVRRLRSNTPLQSLMLLNDTTSNECAENFAKLMRTSDGDLEAQMRYGFARATCRSANDDELHDLMEMYQRIESTEGEETAMKAVATVLLNLDEVVTN